MSDDRKQIDLIIQAAVKGGRSLTDVAKSISDIEKGLEGQAGAAKNARAGLDQLLERQKALIRVQSDLAEAQNSLVTTQAKLKSQSDLAAQYEKIGKSVSTLNERLATSTKAYNEHKDKLDALGVPTERQQRKLEGLKRGLSDVQNLLIKSKLDYETLGVSLRAAGVDTGRLADEQIRLYKTQGEAGAALKEVQARAVEAAKLQSAEAALIDKIRASKQALLNQRLSEIKIAEDEADARRKVAAAAEAEARGYKTLGTAAKSLSAPSSGLRDVIQGILNPAEQTRTTLAGIEEQVRKVGTAVTAIKGPVENYRGQVQELAAIQKSISDKASLVDAFARQRAALKEAADEYSRAKAQVLQHADALRQSTGANEQLSLSLRNARAALGDAQRNLSAQIATTRQMRESMRDAGITTNDLVGAQRRLVAAARTAVSSLGQLEAAHEKHGDSVKRAKGQYDFFNNSGRTTLSLLQRVRGEVLALAASYVGLYGAISGVKKVIDAVNTRQSIRSQLAISVGDDAAKITEEWDYLEKQADRLGVSFENLALGYAKFLASAKPAGATRQEVRYVFEAFTEVGRVAHLSKEDMDGVFRALGQMMSKTKIMSEELRQQLGDRLFGVFGVAKEALKKQFPDFDKALQEGKVGAQYLLEISEAYRKLVQGPLPMATKSLQAEQERLNNEIFKFKTLIADSGFEAEYTKLLKSLSDFFKSEDGKKFAQDLSEALSTVVRGLRFVVENLETIKVLMTLVFGMYASKLALGLGNKLIGLGETFAKLATTMTAVDKARLTLLKGFVAINAFFAGFSLAGFVAQFDWGKKAFIALAAASEATWLSIKAGVTTMWLEIKQVFVDGFMGAVASILETAAWAAGKIGADDLAKIYGSVAAGIRADEKKIGEASRAVRDKLERDLAVIKDLAAQAWADVDNPRKGGVFRREQRDGTTGKPDKSGIKTQPDDKELEKRKNLNDEILLELQDLQNKIRKHEEDNLQERIKAITDSYLRLDAKIRELDKLGASAQAKAARERLEEYKNTLVEQEKGDFAERLMKQREQIANRVNQLNVELGKGDRDNLKKRLDAVEDAEKETFDRIKKARMSVFAAAAPGSVVDTSREDALEAELRAAIQAKKVAAEREFYEKKINLLLEDRKAQLELIAINEKVGMITSLQAREQIAKVISDTQPKIEQLASSSIEFAQRMRDAASAAGDSTATWDTLIAKMREAKDSANEFNEKSKIAAQLSESFATGAANTFGSIGDAIGQAVSGMSSWREAINATRSAFLKFAADFLREIAMMIAKRAILKALESQAGTGGVFGSIADIIIGAGVKHSGGVVGAPGGSMRSVPASWFANAPRYHGGGVPGLSSDEYATILKRNEEVLRADDPRNILNGGSSAGGSSSPMGVKIINMIDSGSVVSEGLSTQSGEKAFFNFIRANRTGLKQILA